MKLSVALGTAAAALLLSACGSETSSFMIDGNDTALTLERIKEYPWSEWELELIVRRNPDCQRRHKLKPTNSDSVKVELFSPEPGVFIVRQGKRWYVTELATCQLQSFKEPPPEPGQPVGNFVTKDGKLKFVRDAQG